MYFVRKRNFTKQGQRIWHNVQPQQEDIAQQVPQQTALHVVVVLVVIVHTHARHIHHIRPLTPRQGHLTRAAIAAPAERLGRAGREVVRGRAVVRLFCTRLLR